MQIFEVTWSEGTVTPELISSLIRQYVTQGGLYGTVVVKEVSQQSTFDEIQKLACEIRSKIKGSNLYGEPVDMENIDHLIVASYMIGQLHLSRR